MSKKNSHHERHETHEKKKPEIRFQAYNNEWEEKELGEVGEFNPKAELPEIFEYVDLESVIGTELVYHRKENKVHAPSRAQRLAQSGDLFYQTVRPYQKNNYLFQLHSENYVFSTGYAQIRPNNNDGNFLLSFVQTAEFVKSVMDRCTGTSYPAINSNELSLIKVLIPSPAEQSQIGTFFQNIDNLISLRQKKLEKLKNTKKAFLNKMFPKEGSDVPEIRFEGFSGKWERKELGKVKDVRDGTHDSPKYIIEGYPLVTSKNLSYSGLDLSNVSYISLDDFMKINKRSKVDVGDIIFGMIGTIGNPIMIDRDDFAIKNVALIKNGGDILNVFLLQLLKSHLFKNYIQNEYSGSTQSFLGLNKIREYIFPMPNIEEQSKIGQFFQTLDRLIGLQDKEIEKLKNLKKAFLEKMFV
jgi:type I restriction enzyme, S subunit